MSYMRVTQGQMTNRVLTNLGRHTRRLLALQEQLATGLRVNAPSDDPMAARLGIDTRTAIGKSEQYLSNIQAASPLLSETESAIDTALQYLNRAESLAQQGANGTYNESQLDSLAIEVNEILEGMLSTANRETNGRFLFSGTRTQTVPFEATRNAAGEITAVTYRGNDEHTEVAVADGLTVTTNETGTDIFTGSQDVFQVLIGIRDSLRAGDTADLGTTQLNGAAAGRDQFLRGLSRIGAITNRLENAESDTENFIFEYQELLSDTVEADYTETLISLNTQNNAYQAALNAAARVIQPSLLDFVR